MKRIKASGRKYTTNVCTSIDLLNLNYSGLRTWKTISGYMLLINATLPVVTELLPTISQSFRPKGCSLLCFLFPACVLYFRDTHQKGCFTTNDPALFIQKLVFNSKKLNCFPHTRIYSIKSWIICTVPVLILLYISVFSKRSHKDVEN